MDIIERIKETGIIPVLVVTEENNIEKIIEALIEGGINCVEVTYRTKEASNAIKTIREKYPEVLVGAGTILTIKQVQEAIASGAEFMVSPGSNEKVIKYCIDKNITIIPGVATPSEIEKNLELNINVMKFFPAESLGGVKTLKAMSAPYGNVHFMPTGGIKENNLKSYLENDKVIACGGSFMVEQDLLETNNYSVITRLVKQAKKIVNEVR